MNLKKHKSNLLLDSEIQKPSQTLEMPHDTGSFDSFGCQAMAEPNIFHVVVKENLEDELKV